MEILGYIVIGLLALLLLKRMVPIKGVNSISTKELKTMLHDRNKQFVDVRTQGEFKGNHIREFTNIPLNVLSTNAEKKLSKEKEVVVICQSGMRSAQAAKMLKKLGYNKVTNVRGGMSAWS